MFFFRIAYPCYIVASGCLCFGLRAALLTIQVAASRLSLATIRIFVLTRCCGLSFNYSANKTYQSFGKSNGKNNQIHGANHPLSKKEVLPARRTYAADLLLSYGIAY